MNYDKIRLAVSLEALLPPGRIITESGQVERLSKDYYWYSPVLKRQLEQKSADFVAAPESVEEVATVLRFAYQNEIPVTARGAGTGNYGQSVPLFGGIVLDLSRMTRILEITADGTCRAEPGARLGTMEEAARKVGWELRCYPSTFVKASVGGFLCGGSGGIGSITYGGLSEGDNVRGIDLLTLEENPRRIQLRGVDIRRGLHAWGTTGVLIEAQLALGPKVPWGQIAACFPSFDGCLDFTERFAESSPWRKRLVTCFEPPVPSYFKPIQKFLCPNESLVLLELETDGLDATIAEIKEAGGTVTFRQEYSEPRPGPLLSDFTWNHTTLWAKKADPTLTYLQCGFDSSRFREQFAAIKSRYGDEYFHHVEFVRGGGKLSVGALPIIRFTTEERLQEIIDFCWKVGVTVADPHIFQLQRGVRLAEDDIKIEAKGEFDPKGLMNPGRIHDYPLPASLTPIGLPIAS